MENGILALIDLHGSASLGQLTEDRPLAVTTLTARFAFIDFVLSNFSQSGIDDIAILIQDNARSVTKHIGRDSTYLKNSKTGFLDLLTNEKAISRPFFNTDINNLLENDYILYDNESKYVIIAPVNFIYKANFQKLVEKHIKSGRVCSLLYSEQESYEKCSDCQKVIVDALGNAQKFEDITKKDDGKKFNLALDTYILNRAFFNEILTKAKEVSWANSFSEMIKYVSKTIERVNCIKVEGELKVYNSFKKYFSNSMALLDEKAGIDFLLDREPVYTTTHNSRPVIYGVNSSVTNSIVANGSSIDGTCKHSIISRDVIIEEGATVENCILFSHTIVKKGVTLRNVVSNKRCTFKSKKIVSGTKDDPLYIPRGAII